MRFSKGGVGNYSPKLKGESMSTEIELPTKVPSLESSDKSSFDDLDNLLRTALNAEVVTTAIVQAAFSIIVIKGRWSEAKAWANTQTGDLYMDKEKIPKDTDVAITDINRFTRVDDWLNSLETVRGFSRSTCYSRHAEIVRQMELLHRPFEDAVKGVMLSPGYSRMMMDYFTEGNMFLEERILKLVTPLLLETRKAEIEEHGANVYRAIILQQLERDEDKLQSGVHPRRVIADVKKTVGTYAKYTIKLSEGGRSFLITQDIDEVVSKYHLLVECEDPRETPPLAVIHWLASRLKVKI
jgi:hypothetical protein